MRKNSHSHTCKDFLAWFFESRIRKVWVSRRPKNQRKRQLRIIAARCVIKTNGFTHVNDRKNEKTDIETGKNNVSGENLTPKYAPSVWHLSTVAVSLTEANRGRGSDYKMLKRSFHVTTPLLKLKKLTKHVKFTNNNIEDQQRLTNRPSHLYT